MSRHLTINLTSWHISKEKHMPIDNIKIQKQEYRNRKVVHAKF